jgi:L-histidine N-alpha-methyltransferase
MADAGVDDRLSRRRPCRSVAAAEGDSGALVLRRDRVGSCSRTITRASRILSDAQRNRPAHAPRRATWRPRSAPAARSIELGSGSSTKTPLLLDAIDPAAYVPVDISGDFLRDSARGARGALSWPSRSIRSRPTSPSASTLPRRNLPACPSSASFPGSYDRQHGRAHRGRPACGAGAAALGDGALLLIGVDRIKDASRTLERAYDDPAGVTAAFNLNLLERINRELSMATIPVENFSHRAIWDDVHARIEMHLVAACDIDFTVDGRSLCIWPRARRSTARTATNTARAMRTCLLARIGGWTPVATWDDVDPAFALILAEATAFRSAP